MQISSLDSIWLKCRSCSTILYKEDLIDNLYVCPHCDYHMRLTSNERALQLVDIDTFIPMYEHIQSKDILNFEGYNDKLIQASHNTSSTEAILTGIGKINGITSALALMDSYFMLGSMGTAVGERLTRLIEYATLNKLPLICFTASGGARMQESILSLMQMAKISQAIHQHSSSGLFYLVVLTDPTTGGVTASFAMQGDIIISEPGALVGFAGRRVINQTIKETLPPNFQLAEFLLEKGMIDAIVHRKELKNYIYHLLDIHKGCELSYE